MCMSHCEHTMKPGRLDAFWRKNMIFDPFNLERPLTGSKVIGHLCARSLVIVTKFE